jgi:DNA-directed RNA polymerase specialized sigma subunit
LADSLDRVLSDYFTGKLEILIAVRKMELKTHVDVDENIGGGRAQNKYSNPILDNMIREEEDEILTELVNQKYMIEAFYRAAPDQVKKVLQMVYQANKTWEAIALTMNVDRTTVIRWRLDFKNGIVSHLNRFMVYSEDWR